MILKILTFDIEDWFHILDHGETKSVDTWNDFESRVITGTERILELLKTKKVKATFFILGWIAEKHPSVVRKIKDAGFEIGTHSYAHQLAFEQSPKEFREDLYKSISIIGDITGTAPRMYRAPGFSLCKENLWVFDELVNAGIEVDCSVFPTKRAHGGLSEYNETVPGRVKTANGIIKCFPMSIDRLLSREIVLTGGGYFRLFPYFMIKNALKNSSYNMTYFHPRDFDAEQPLIPGLGAARKFKSYVGLKGSFKKLEKMVSQFTFSDIGTYEKEINWDDTTLYKIVDNKFTC